MNSTWAALTVRERVCKIWYCAGYVMAQGLKTLLSLELLVQFAEIKPVRYNHRVCLCVNFLYDEGSLIEIRVPKWY